ncbi:site-specific integrase [Enterovirga sp. CN4-39]|uniref:site-specific integrase n=1 Tax=Enterovirga sp. CN4-39 TaxID=3400910 RepID=UPI003C035BBA
MGTIIERPRKGGAVGYHAQIVVKSEGILHRETKTFDRHQAAAAWIKRRERELREPGALALAKVDDPTLSAVIDRYVKDTRRPLGRTKAQVLNTIKGFDFAEKRCSTITSADLVAFAQELLTGRQPQTVANYLAHLSSVFAIAKPAWGYPLDSGQMDAALKVSKRLGLTAKSTTRDRRPTLAELDKLMTHFGERQQRRPGVVPMQKVIAFAIFSTRRQEEITRIQRADLDVGGKRILVRDMKNPGEKQGNDVWCDLPDPALAIIQSMPERDGPIFPYTTDAIGAAFTRACALLGIEDLHFHDLRHDGVSRLFEMGMNIPHAAAVSGHRSWTSLKRYTHLRQSGDKYASWKWATLVTTPELPGERPLSVEQGASALSR